MSDDVDDVQPSLLPAPLNQLDEALMRRWAIPDDVEREQATFAATDEDLRRLIAQFSPEVFRALNDFLDSFDDDEPEDVLWLHSVAQAALEAKAELANRNK